MFKKNPKTKNLGKTQIEERKKQKHKSSEARKRGARLSLKIHSARRGFCNTLNINTLYFIMSI
jgi:hypothetical protein